MVYRPRSVAGCIAVLWPFLVGIPRAQPPQAAPAQYRTGTDIVTVDVAVLDREGTPVLTLTPDDFTLSVNGRPRPIQSVQLMTSPGGAPGTANVGSAQPKKAVHVSAAPRRFVLVIDREHIPLGEGQETLNAAAKFIDALPPDDDVALWTTLQASPTLRFDESREAVRRRLLLAVGAERLPAGVSSAFRPATSPSPTDDDVQAPSEVGLANVGNLIDALAAFDRPKHVVLVTGGPLFTFDKTGVLDSLVARAAVARATVHAIQVSENPGRPDRRTPAPEPQWFASAAFMLAGQTGGLAITPVSGEIGFKRLTRELSAAYVLAFEVEAGDRDGKVHQITVQVRRQGWGGVVRARKTFQAQPKAALAVSAPAPPVVAAPSAAPTAMTPSDAVLTPHAVSAPPGASASPARASTSSSKADAALDEVIHKMAQYVAAYGPQASVIVAVEKYSQQVTVEGRPARPRNLVAEFAIVKTPNRVGWTGFRDVVEVDGKAVSDRRDRLTSLLTGPAGREADLRRLSDESARYNVGPVIRNFNVPTTALFFFHPTLVDRFTFRRAGTKTIDGVGTWVLDFKETQRPTLVMKRDGADVPCEGTVWVVPADGTVVRTRLRLRNFANTMAMTDPARSPGDRVPVTEYVSSPMPAMVSAPAVQPQVPSQPQQPGGAQPQAPQGAGQGQGQAATAPAQSPSPQPERPRYEHVDLLPTILEIETMVDVDVTYRRAADSGMWLPDKMTELYEGPIPRGTSTPMAARVLGSARYSDFKRFDTSVKIVLPK